ncbi:MAG: HAMP domain-containing sensor histidine kinase, partial [Melioribacteraceae bacterium]
RYSMLLNRREDVHEIIKTLSTEIGVNEIRIYNKQGIIIFSTNPDEVRKKVDMNKEVCIACHNSSVPLQTLTMQNKIRIYKNSENKRFLALINPIQNDLDCSNAECHAHSPNVNILGVLDVVVSLDQLDAIIQKSTNEIILSSVILVLAISFFSGLFISILVNKPLKKIRDGIEEVGNGNLNFRISVNSKNEFGQVARRFNDMSNKLNEAYHEIKNWSETLNDKVNEKTEELKNIYKHVSQIEKLASLGKLSATVAHELNNPLAGILVMSKVIKKKIISSGRENDCAEILEQLELISNESARCGKIVKDLLIFSHSEPDEFADENLSKIIDKAVTVIKHHLEINRIVLVKEFPESPVIINCNAGKIQQAVMVLLINSIEAMPNGGNIIVNLSFEKDDVILRIIDEGTGIAEKDLTHIFEPFYTTKDASSGTGVGLSVAYGIITSHNGNIEVEKTSDHGTTFKITLLWNAKLSI